MPLAEREKDSEYGKGKTMDAKEAFQPGPGRRPCVPCHADLAVPRKCGFSSVKLCVACLIGGASHGCGRTASSRAPIHPMPSKGAVSSSSPICRRLL